MHRLHKNKSGFTIVELLVVIVIIGILAAITIVTYTGISQKATVASLTSDLDNASKLLKLDQVTNMAYPATLAAANNGNGIKASPGTSYQYFYNNTTNPQYFCITATNGSNQYRITNDGTPSAGNCLNYGLVLNLDAGNTTSYPGTGTSWIDLSGSGNNSTLYNGVSYSNTNGGVLTFDGVNDYVGIPNSTSINPTTNSFSVSMWFRMDAAGSTTNSILMNKENAYESSAGGGVFTYAWQPYWDWVSGFTVNVGQWYNAVIVYDGTNQYVYENGSLVLSRPQTGNMVSNSSELDIGARGGGTLGYLPGTVGDAQIYNRALSSGEITQNFNALRGRYGL